MSRRESRVSMNVRQNDALFEFENFKKKFLLANKHITKLNSTLSVRIEELNAQISTLYVENLRLRASEIALAAQLKREREKSRKIMSETEAATLNLTKHLSYLRSTFNIRTSSPTPPSPPSPKARRPPPPNPNPSPNSPQGIRISRPPDVPGIHEEDEPSPSSSEQMEGQAGPHHKAKSKPRLSASRLPLPSRVSSPPPQPGLAIPIMHVDLNESSTRTRRKPARRQSGLLTVNTRGLDEGPLSVPRAPSPAFGSPIRREAGLAEEQDEIAAVNDDMPVDVEMDAVLEFLPRKEKQRAKGKEREVEVEEGVRSRERKRPREEEEPLAGGSKPKVKNVTNSPKNRAALLPIDNTVYEQPDFDQSPPNPRSFLGTESTSPPLADQRRTSPSPSPPETEGGGTGGRERRTRKSVNYAEPKLNTKMRKPDPAPKKRSSAAAVMVTYKPTDEYGNEADNDTEARSSLELPLRANNGNYINPEMFPLPPSRPGSAVPAFSPTPSIRSMTTSSSSVATAVKRKKSRPQIVLDDDESDGAQADAEYGGGRGSSSTSSGGGWVNIEGRRRAAAPSAGSVRRSGVALDDERRHSLAV